MRNLLLNVHQRGGDDVTCIRPIPKVQFWLLLLPSVRLKMKRHRSVFIRFRRASLNTTQVQTIRQNHTQFQTNVANSMTYFPTKTVWGAYIA